MSLSELAATLEEALPAQDRIEPARTKLWLTDVTLLAGELLQMPAAFISVTDRTTTRFLAVQGRDREHAVRQSTLCDLVAARRTTVVIADADVDPALADHPAVRDGLRSYVGVPISDGESALSVALCVSDRRPRPDVHGRVPLLQALARVAERAFTA